MSTATLTNDVLYILLEKCDSYTCRKFVNTRSQQRIIYNIYILLDLGDDANTPHSRYCA